jgi:hypothetical protein
MTLGVGRRMAAVVYAGFASSVLCGGDLTAQSDVQTWVLADEASLTLGAADGPSHILFDGLIGVVVQSDGTFAVADCGSGEIRFFGSDGRFVKSVGRIGRGPGEFDVLTRLVSGPADSLAAFDVTLSRVTIFGPEGSVARVLAVERYTDVLGWLPNGLLLAVRSRRTPVPTGSAYNPTAEATLARDSAVVLLLDGSTGKVHREVGAWLGMRRCSAEAVCDGPRCHPIEH